MRDGWPLISSRVEWRRQLNQVAMLEGKFSSTVLVCSNPVLCDFDASAFLQWIIVAI